MYHLQVPLGKLEVEKFQVEIFSGGVAIFFGMGLDFFGGVEIFSGGIEIFFLRGGEKFRGVEKL